MIMPIHRRWAFILACALAASTLAVVGTSSSCGGGAATTAAQQTPPPTLTVIFPTSGSTAGGTAVTLLGNNFQSGATVTFGGVAAGSVTVTNALQIVTATPAHALGKVDIVVKNPDSQTATLTQAYNYASAPPSITGVSPSSAPAAGGTPVVITGDNFQTGATVSFGGTAATSVSVASATQVDATSPAHAAGTVGITVTNPDGQASLFPNGFTFVAAPTITSILPNAGPVAGGTLVVISGQNFQSNASVSFGTTAATSVVVVSSTQIQATAPAGSAGVVNVVVTNPDGQGATLSGGYTYANLHSVSLAWDPSTSTVAGYNIYRGTVSGGPYTRITSSLVGATCTSSTPAACAYTDPTALGGQTYYYVATAADSNNVESVYSNETSAAVPSP